jgi:hypothetical protein
MWDKCLGKEKNHVCNHGNYWAGGRCRRPHSAGSGRECTGRCARCKQSCSLGGARLRAFDGADGVFVLIPPIFDPSPGFTEAGAVISAVRDALARTRPARAVCLSTVGAQATQPNLLNQLAMMERELGTLDLPIAFIRAAWFMENASWDVASARDGQIHSFLQRDGGAVAAPAVDRPPYH